jgi:hypothetical protein
MAQAHPEHLPAGMSPTSSTSHQLRSALKRRGWQVQESDDEVRVVMASSGFDVNAGLQAPKEPAKISVHEQRAPTNNKPWSWEGNVVCAVCDFLKSTGWTIEDVADTERGQAGADIKARRGNQVLIVEVKGYPSKFYERGSRAGHLKRTNPANQARHWVAEALMTAVLRQSESRADEVAIAFPEFPVYTKLLARLGDCIGKLSLHVLIVKESGAVITTDRWLGVQDPSVPA